MSYQEAEQTRQRRQSSQQAIALAMQGRWQEAVAANKSLLENFPTDVDACNRLGRAYMELGDYSLARGAYERTIELDPYNTIAQKNLDRLSHLGEAVVSGKGSLHKVEPQQFIEEVGKAGVVNLHHLAPPEVLAKTVAGGPASLKINGTSLTVENSREEYLGVVEPKHGQRLIKLMERGNRYSAAIVSATDEAVTIIIREVYQHPSQAGRLSFPPKGTESFRPYIGDRIIRRELEYEEALPGGPSYTVIGGEDAEILPDESLDIDVEADNEE
ncbi:MAG: tetratricopeptide repeat protein [Chloroflexi bacterium]|nr:tetratricopeptide repeat protein [Chloroflexota bacterium]